MYRLCTALTVAAAFALAGCGAPCDNYCESSGNYIEYCLENGSQEVWATASTAGWENWGAADKDAYIGDCQEDVGAQALASDDTTGFEEFCTDDANRYAQLEERGFCADLP